MDIDCMYSCTLCGIVKARVNIPVRSKEQNVVEWMQNVVTVALVADHEKRSPNCHPQTFAEVYIPIAGAEFIGGPPIQ